MSEFSKLENNKFESWSISTYARLKPPSPRQHDHLSYTTQEFEMKDKSSRSILEFDIPSDADPGIVHNNADSGKLRYEFDHIFDIDSTQDSVFEITAKDRIRDVMEGMNCTIFAYGQTGSGKTFSICGGEEFEDRGIIPRSISYIFDQALDLEQKYEGFTLKCQISFTEVYKENVYDLLDPHKRALPVEAWTPVQVFESDQGLVLRNVNVFEVQRQEDALRLFFLGSSNRIKSSTTMNDASSRSHAIFTIVIHTQRLHEGKHVLTSGKVNLVDLAGSERMYKLANTRGQIKEAKSINLSLHYLEQVIIRLRDENLHQRRAEKAAAKQNAGIALSNLATPSSLPSVMPMGTPLPSPSASASSSADPSPPPSLGHIPYRNSTLTNMLRDSLGGNCRSCFLLTLSTDRQHFEESVSTCRFGQRCGEVKVTVRANSEVALPDQLRELSSQVKSLERQLHSSEEQLSEAKQQIEGERERFHRACELRPLDSEEKQFCLSYVQRLRSIATELNESQSPPPSDSSPPTDRATALLDFSQSTDQNELYESLKSLDKTVLVEMVKGLGSLFQTLYIEREKLKQEEILRQQRKQAAKAEREAKAQLEAVQEQEKLREEALRKQSHRSEVTFGMDMSEETVSMLVNGATFFKMSRSTGLRTIRHAWLQPNLLYLSWRHIGSAGTTTTVPLKDYELAEIDPKNKGVGCPIVIRARKVSLSRTVVLEYVNYDTFEQNREAALIWVEALNKCIQRAENYRK